MCPGAGLSRQPAHQNERRCSIELGGKQEELPVDSTPEPDHKARVQSGALVEFARGLGGLGERKETARYSAAEPRGLGSGHLKRRALALDSAPGSGGLEEGKVDLTVGQS